MGNKMIRRMGEEEMWELYQTFPREDEEQNVKGFTYGARKHDFFGTSPTFHFFFFFFFLPTQLHFLSFSVLFINGKTALITTNYFNFIVYKERIIYRS